MLSIAYYFLQVALCSGLMMGYYWLVLRNKRFHQYNRFYLLAIALLSWIVPLIKIRWPHPVVNENPQVLQFLSAVADSNSQIEENLTQNGFAWSWNMMAPGIYLLVAAVLLLGMLRAFLRIYRLLQVHSGKTVGDVYLILTHAKGTPFSFFRYIFWNEDIDIRSEAGKQILQHELTHVQQKHSVDKVLIQVILVVGWFNPFFWILRKEMEMIHEFIADKKAVNNGDTASLAQMLLAAAYPQQQFSLTHPFFFSPIKRRLQMLTNNKKPRFSYIRRLIVLPLLAIVVVLFAFRNEEQRANNSLSMASVVENVIKSAYQKPLADSASEKTNNRDTVIFKKDTVVVNGGSRILIVKDGGEVSIKTTVSNSILNTSPLLRKALIIIDGKKASNTVLEALDPNQIKTIDILKDESAVALYGEEGRNGVVQIRTKSFAGLNDETMAIRDSITGGIFSGTFSGRIPDLAATVRLVKKYPDTLGWIKDQFGEPINNQPLVMVDGVKGELRYLKPSEISSVNVLKGKSAIGKYGEDGKNGVIEVITKTIEREDPKPEKITLLNPVSRIDAFRKRNPDVKQVHWNNQPLKIIIQLKDGTEETYDLSKPESKKRAENKYGKLPFAPPPPPPPSALQPTITSVAKPGNSAAIFTQVQVPAEFPGGLAAWTKYLQRNLNTEIPAKNGAPPGKYTVIISFIVDKTGNLNNVKALTDPGYGTKEEAIRLIVKGPKWKPATQNGKNVKYLHTQSITFLVAEK